MCILDSNMRYDFFYIRYDFHDIGFTMCVRHKLACYVIFCDLDIQGRRHTLDPVALAALASREDFSRVSLRKTKGPGKEKDEYDGSLPVMLIQIKGKQKIK